MAGSVQVSLPISWSLHHQHKQRQPLSATTCALSKQGHRFFSSLAAAAGDDSSAQRLIRKFVASSSKPIALNALSHLLSSDNIHPNLSSLALPLYTRITTTSWFYWNPKLVACLIALLDQQGQFEDAETLLSESVQKLGFRDGDQDLAIFYCDLIDSCSKRGSKQGVLWSYGHLKQLLFDSPNFSLRRRASEMMIRGLCTLDLPHEAEKLMEEMTALEGFKPSPFEFKCIINGYGRTGSFTEMRRVLGLMEDEGYVLDTICSNIVLSSYGAHSELSELVSWLRKMKDSDIQFSFRTYNTVLNSCPTIMSILRDPKLLPLTMEGLIEKLPKEEGFLVEELIGSPVLMETLKWSCSEGKLDLHGMHLGSALVIMLQWMEELRSGFHSGSLVVPVTVIIVCGAGRHSGVRGESPVKALIKEMMIRLRSPLRIDRKNVGCFVAKGKAVKEWLCLQH
ncbi:pentatricopeptide repeat-containing protein At2g17033 [Telopea speciosissima]|uniref:pentatricopeptide repeat-containing protein At2g17033 n=1 Tax=Telopea speciosissima TaxID=54955 RepID=UPI001CC5317C|nr:pentatricopeptide repeat-containing protein At2g17033 [Telopea speciosissima]